MMVDLACIPDNVCNVSNVWFINDYKHFYPDLKFYLFYIATYMSNLLFHKL